ncbi:MAG: FAD-binding and (Fe-S)-binding domain-containing protein [Thermodesulfobacteriota bacterium]
MLISLTREHPGYAPILSFVDGDPAAILAVEFYGESESEVEKKSNDLLNYLSQHNIKCKKTSALSQIAQSNVWSVRKAGLGILMSRRGDYKPIPCIEDVSVPVDNLSSYVRDILDIINRLGTEAGFYGHASAGCLHVRPLINLKFSDGIDVMKELTAEALKLALRYGGVMSGEHGDGLQRTHLNERLFGPNIFKAMHDLKAAFDPEGRLNPGKIVDKSLPDENLRYGPKYETNEIKTYFDWSSDGGFDSAVEMCNGQGLCRKLGEGIMCPSYMATKDETDATRARANALRAVISGKLPIEEINSYQMYKVFDLCLACKACKKECPSGVDVAKMKMEFLAHYNKANGKSFRDSIFGYIHELSRYSAPLAKFANPLMKSWLSRWIFRRLGIHPNRSLPNFSNEIFTHWFYNRKNENNTSKIIYFHDTWVSFYHPEIGKAAIKLLEAAGFEVILVPQRVCCGRPMLSKGLLELARFRARKNVSLLAPYARRGIPIIGTEPSCILTFRDEYPDLLPGDEDAKTIADNSFLLEEYLNKLDKNERIKITWKTDGPSVLFHGHCHQRAIIGIEPSMDILSSAGCSVRDSGAGCCGMAGSFGFESEHYEISKIIGEDRLFPAVRDVTPETVVAVSGVSCHQQIEHFTGKKPRHIAEVLADQLQE